MANLIQTLTRIEPTRGLIDYVQHVKPFHTKVLDIQIEYVYRDLAIGTAIDRDEKLIEKRSTVRDVLFADCGFGHIWDSPVGLPTPHAIIRAEARDESSPTANSFTISPPTAPVLNFYTTSFNSNSFRLCTSFPITASNTNDRSFTVSGNLAGLVTPGLTVGLNIERLSGGVVNKTYVVSTVTPVLGNTIVVVTEPIPAQIIFPATLAVFTSVEDIPSWLTKPTKVNVSSINGDLPTPIQYNRQYYVVPGSTPGIFNLSATRYPTKYADYADIFDYGTGLLGIQQAEPFVPGDSVEIGSTYLSRNNGRYTIRYMLENAGEFTLIMNEPVPNTTPVGLMTDGSMYPASSGFDTATECELTSAPDLYGRGRVSEVLSFQFGLGFDEDWTGEAIENPLSGGFSTSGWGSPDGYDVDGLNFNATTTQTTSLILTPAGFDTLFFDVSAFDDGPTNPVNIVI
jgi:hypothetical protein